MSQRFLNSAVLFSMLTLSAAGCSKKDKQEGQDKAAAVPAEVVPAAVPNAVTPDPVPTELPTEIETVSLALDDNAIPATMEVPQGATVIADSPTKFRVQFGDGRLFGVRIQKGTAFNTDLDKVVKILSTSSSGGQHEIIEHTDTLLRYKTKANDYSTHSFQLLVTIGESTWVCTQGTRPAWTDEQISQQLAACKTLKAE